MNTSYPDENALFRALLQEQQTIIRKMAEYNRLLSQRVAAYASKINRLKALVAKFQRMQFGKSSEKLREKTQRQGVELSRATRIHIPAEAVGRVEPVLQQRLGIDNNIAENALRGVALGRKNWLFAGSDTGGEQAVVLYSLIGTCRLNGVEPETWLRYVLGHIQDWPVNRLRDLLPWKADLTST